MLIQLGNSYATPAQSGGHFAPMEEPKQVLDHIRVFFRGLLIASAARLEIGSSVGALAYFVGREGWE